MDGSLESTDVAAIAEIAAQLEVRSLLLWMIDGVVWCALVRTHAVAPAQMSKALDTSRKAVGGGGAKGRAGRGARQQLDFIVEGMRGGACVCGCL